MSSPPFECLACGAGSAASIVEVPEMMLGTRERFRYGVCAGCGSLGIINPPSEMAKYYPRGEYVPFAGARRRRGVSTVVTIRDRASYQGRGAAHRIFGAFGILEPGIVAVRWLSLPRESRVLDVGCGGGSLLTGLARNGWPHLSGIDPYASPRLPEGVRFRPTDLTGFGSERFDLIIFNHSLEHLFDPRSALQEAGALLAGGGACSVRIPIAAEAWKAYGANWFQLDAPRHVFVPTQTGMERLAERAGFRVADSRYDSDEGQYPCLGAVRPGDLAPRAAVSDGDRSDPARHRPDRATTEGGRAARQRVADRRPGVVPPSTDRRSALRTKVTAGTLGWIGERGNPPAMTAYCGLDGCEGPAHAGSFVLEIGSHWNSGAPPPARGRRPAMRHHASTTTNPRSSVNGGSPSRNAASNAGPTAARGGGGRSHAAATSEGAEVTERTDPLVHEAREVTGRKYFDAGGADVAGHSAAAHELILERLVFQAGFGSEVEAAVPERLNEGGLRGDPRDLIVQPPLSGGQPCGDPAPRRGGNDPRGRDPGSLLLERSDQRRDGVREEPQVGVHPDDQVPVRGRDEAVEGHEETVAATAVDDVDVPTLPRQGNDHLAGPVGGSGNIDPDLRLDRVVGERVGAKEV